LVDRSVGSANQKQFVKELKKVYQAFTKEEAEIELDKLEEKWGKKYPIVFTSWRKKWENLSVYFKYPADIRKVIYTTNIIESVHRQFRTLTKLKVLSLTIIAYLNYFLWVFKMPQKNGLCL